MSSISAPAPYYANHPYGGSQGSKGVRPDEATGRKQHRGGGLWPSSIQDSEQQLKGLTLQLDEEEDDGAEAVGRGRPPRHREGGERYNSEGVSPVMPSPLPTAGRSGAHRHLGSSSGIDPWHEHNELPASADATAISSKFNIYREAAARGQWEVMALGYDAPQGKPPSGSRRGSTSGSGSSRKKAQEHGSQPRDYQDKPRLFDYTGNGSRSTQAQARARSASSPASYKKAQRSGMPYPIFQRTAPKHDRIGVALEACGPSTVASPDGGGGAGRAPPATSNSNLDAAAVVRVAEEDAGGRSHSRSSSRHHSIGSSTGSFRQVYDRQPDGSYVRRVDLSQGLDPAMLDARLSSSSSSSSASSSRAVSPLDHSVQTFLRVPAAEAEGHAGGQHEALVDDVRRSHQPPQHQHRARTGSSSLRPGGLLNTSASCVRPARRLTTDVLSPTGSSSSSSHHHFPSGSSHDMYGARNLATVSCRKSASIVTAATAEAAAAANSPASAASSHRHRHRRTAGSSASISSSSSLLGRLKEGSMEVLARFGVVTPPSPKSYERPAISVKTHAMHDSRVQPPILLLPSSRAHGHSSSSASLGTSRSSGRSRVAVHDMARLPPTSSHSHHSRGPSDSSLSSSSGSDSDADQQAQHSSFSYATECVRTALEVIIARLQAAQARGPEATVKEARIFVEGGGVDALLRGLETLGNDRAVAHNLLYVLRVVVMDPSARRTAASGAKGRMLMEQLPAVMRAHAQGPGPILADGLAVMAALLEDPVTKEGVGPLLLTPEALGLVQDIHIQAKVGGASKEARLCAHVLKHGVATEQRFAMPRAD